jgi:hypothetical protein
MNAPEESKATQGPKQLRICQHKSPLFRVVQAEGVWCSVNALDNFHLTFYSEMQPIATMIEYKLNESGGFEEDISARKFENDAVSVREMEVDVVLSLQAAKIVRGALDYYIKLVDERIAAKGIAK